MEEYEVRELFNRKVPTVLSIYDSFVIEADKDKFKRMPRIPGEYSTFKFSATIVNDGSIVEKDYKLNIYLTAEDGLYVHDISWETIKDTMNYTLWNGGVKISALGTMPIFPEESIDIARFQIRIEASKYDYFIDNTKVRLLLLYSGGSDEIETTLKELLLR